MPAAEKNARRSLSADHRGATTIGPAMEVTRIGFDPSLLQTQISKVPDLFETNAIRFPSGENWG
jgi:hypothetical protein